jgi:membrane protein required for beta-lactamase induction
MVFDILTKEDLQRTMFKCKKNFKFFLAPIYIHVVEGPGETKSVGYGLEYSIGGY